MVVKVKLVGVLRALSLGKEYIELNGVTTVREVINGLRSVNEKLFKRVFDSSRGELAPDIYVAVNDVDIRLLKGLDTPVRDGDEVLILAYIHGG
ncbi:MoaD/ThiS family protein [Vulcanisaeta distributa]|uniref:ThiamineS protein n=1 Tax=Vulcanisaeta distributa (strain DSM 14429 / JCM 11212 / NBRC 100878 / IC-017) TaxID=572478 RepID=E1QS64_VULDI|nr:MoaD/ThiS family protein [Vulcanisaeta distributa]ADN51896.1 thiamineS protein [Vulcanisaeta distributa DSM 14429]